MPLDPLAIVILAAGRGTRMGSDLPKVLHPLGQVPMVHHVLQTAQELTPERLIVVTGHGAETVERSVREKAPDVIIAHQADQLGTGHAVRMAQTALAGFEGRILVVYGDSPFLPSNRLAEMAGTDADVTLLGFNAEIPGRYGRLVTHGTSVDKIVEAKDATPEELAITLCNSGVMAIRSTCFDSLVEAVDNNNAQQEYYLTDIVELARTRGLVTTAVIGSEAEALGIDTPQALVAGEARFQAEARAALIENGVILQAPETVHLAQDTAIGRDAVIEPNVVFAPGVTVESGAVIRAFSHLEGAHVGAGAVVGPYARLRPGSELGGSAKIGNFVEVKNAEIASGAKVNHLSYIGDASVGENTNIGAGTITCNYDGVFKHRSEIGANSFIGSNSLLVAPVAIGDGAYTATGSVITDDVSSGDMAIARVKQVNKAGLGARMMARLKALKEKS